MFLRRVMCVMALGSCGWAAAQTPATNSNSNTNANDSNTAMPAPPAGVPGVSGQHAPGQPTPMPGDAMSMPVATSSTGAQVSQTSGTKVHGYVTDPDGAAIPGAVVSLQPKQGNAIKVTSGGDGGYAVSVAPGTYALLVTMKGFSSYSVTNLKVPVAAGIAVDAKLAIGETEQVINVEASALQVSVDQDSNASSTILTGKDLDALSDDPDELQSELTALAGPSAGPNGGQIYVDGFTGGQLPPKSSIREIRINQNPFSAQYDRLGYGRIEIFTKPGTDQFHGSFQVNGNASQFNAGSAPNVAGGTYVPPYHTVFMFGSLSGPLAKWASFNVGGSHRDIEDDVYFNGTIYGHAGSTTPCAPGNAACSSLAAQIFTHQPQSRTDISPRFDLQLGPNNVLTTRVQFNQNDQVNQGLGGFVLPNGAYYSAAHTFELQMSDTQTYGLHVINETRGEWEHDRTKVTPTSTALNVDLSGYFSNGGYTGQLSDDHQDHLEFQNYTSIQTKKNFIRLGGRLRSTREALDTEAGTNGAFTYASLTGYIADKPDQFSQTIVNNHDINYDLVDLGLYAETDWKPMANLTVSYGLRYEVQNHWQEKHDFAPRASFAWGVGKSKTKPTTVIRGGVGFFYDRFSSGYVLKLLENNGQNSFVNTYTSTALTANGCSYNNFTACAPTPGSTGTSVYTLPNQTNHLTSPYIIQTAIGADQQLGKIGMISFNYLHSLGVHALAVQDVFCAPNAGAVCTNQSTFNNQYLTEGQFHQDQLMANPKIQLARWLSLFGYYSVTKARGNNSGASTFLSQPGNINADLGRPTFDVRQRYFAAGTISLPHFIQVSPFIVGQSGNPYNITEGQDINHDSVYNDRPYLVTNGVSAAQLNAEAQALASNPNLIVANSIPGCGTYLSRTAPASIVPAGSQIVETNHCTGPALFALNMRVTKTWGFGGSRDKSKDAVQGGRGQGGSQGGGGGGSHSHSGGSGGGPGGPGGFGGGGASTSERYNFSLGVNMMNVTNRENLSTPVGTLTSPYFGKSTQLAGQPYDTNNAAFRLSLQASFTF